MRHLRLPLIAAAALAFLGSSECFARIEPSFELESCAWRASDIVVVRCEDKPDGKLAVLEAWKGSLKKSGTIAIPGLDYTPAISEDFGEKPPAKAATGRRMILFLVREAKVADTTSRPGETGTQPAVTWSAAAQWGGMSVSMVWVEKKQVYDFRQMMNPGPMLLVSRRQTEEQFEKAVDTVLANQVKVEKALAIKDPTERAKTLKPMAVGRNTEMRQAAMDGIAACGKEALPVIHEMLADDSYDQGSVINVLAKAAGKDAGAQITAILKQDLEYWRKRGPLLNVGWWNDATLKERDLYQNRYGRLYACLYSLKPLKYKEAAQVVRDFRDIWRSLPQLEDKSGLTQISQECDSVLKAIEQPDTR